MQNTQKGTNTKIYRTDSIIQVIQDMKRHQLPVYSNDNKT